MKILHTSDWHIGRSLNQRSLMEDQRAAVEGFLEQVRAEKPQVILMAGDLFDRSIPGRDALALVNHALEVLVLDLGIPTIIIGGNHDGGERLGYASGILEKKGLYVVGQYAPQQPPIILEDQAGPVAFWTVPYVKPVEYRDITGEDHILDYDTMYQAILKEIEGRMDPRHRQVLVTHAMVLSGLPDDTTLDDSVRPLEIGGISYARSQYFDAFDYVALGHLHRPQKIGSPHIRYAGSLLKYSFSEIHQKKSITLVDLDGKGQLTTRQLPPTTLRDVRSITGALDDLTTAQAQAQPGREDYLRVLLTDTVRRLSPMETLKKAYPNVLEMSYLQLETATGEKKVKRIKEHLGDPLALFEDFYHSIHGVPMDDEKRALAARIMEECHETH